MRILHWSPEERAADISSSCASLKEQWNLHELPDKRHFAVPLDDAKEQNMSVSAREDFDKIRRLQLQNQNTYQLNFRATKKPVAAKQKTKGGKKQFDAITS